MSTGAGLPDEIATDRVVLRRLVPDDAASVLAYRADPEVCRFQSWEPPTLDEVREYIEELTDLDPEKPGWYQLAITERATGALAGDIGIHIVEHDPRQVELGITLASGAQYRGLGSEAMRAVLNALFLHAGKHRVFASTDPRNLRAIALMRRVGFRLEAHHVESLWFKGGWVDDLIFAMLRREWTAR